MHTLSNLNVEHIKQFIPQPFIIIKCQICPPCRIKSHRVTYFSQLQEFGNATHAPICLPTELAESSSLSHRRASLPSQHLSYLPTSFARPPVKRGDCIIVLQSCTALVFSNEAKTASLPLGQRSASYLATAAASSLGV
jgi:hypothetical protein